MTGREPIAPRTGRSDGRRRPADHPGSRGDRPPKTEENPHCTHSQAQWSGNTWRGEFVCTQPPGKGSFETVVHDRKHYTTQGTMQTQQGTIKTRNEARWVQADCGTLKPAR